MMRAIITITSSQCPGSYDCSVKVGQRKIVGRRSAGGGSAEAAATAMDYAVRVGDGGYHIFAPQAVLDQIPKDMRSRDA